LKTWTVEKNARLEDKKCMVKRHKKLDNDLQFSDRQLHISDRGDFDYSNRKF